MLVSILNSMLDFQETDISLLSKLCRLVFQVGDANILHDIDSSLSHVLTRKIAK